MILKIIWTLVWIKIPRETFKRQSFTNLQVKILQVITPISVSKSGFDRKEHEHFSEPFLTSYNQYDSYNVKSDKHFPPGANTKQKPALWKHALYIEHYDVLSELDLGYWNIQGLGIKPETLMFYQVCRLSSDKAQFPILINLYAQVSLDVRYKIID